MFQLLVSRKAIIFAVLVLFGAHSALDPAQAQRRSRVFEEPQPSPAILPAISDETARCSFAFHAELTPVRDGDARRMAAFDQLARVTEPGLTGKWLFWNKSSKAPQEDRVCVERTSRAGRGRCERWEVKPIDPAKITSPIPPGPNAEELAVLKVIDGFVSDKGATLEFGSNGRQFATLQRFTAEFSSYINQPQHPALCAGVPQMLDFHTTNLVGVSKRLTDVTTNAARAQILARTRIDAQAQLRTTIANAATSDPAAPSVAKPVSIPLLRPGLIATSELVLASVDGLLADEPLKALKSESNGLRQLAAARELLVTGTLPDAPMAMRAAAGASLRMIEAATYAQLQVARVKQVEQILVGPIDQVRKAHRAICTCGS